MSDVIIKEVDGFDVVQYQPKGVCAKMMQFKIKDNIIHDVEILGGCNGNLQGIGHLVEGMKVDDVIQKLKSIDCGGRGTSCPDQLARALEEVTK